MNFDTWRGLICVGMRSLWLGCCLLGYCLLFGAGMSFSVALGPQAWGQETAVLEDPSKTKTENSSTSVEAEVNSDARDASAAQAPDFVRAFKPGCVPRGLQTAVATNRKPAKAERVE